MNNLNGWIGNALFLMALAPFCFIGRICHKVAIYLSAGFMMGWISSRDIDN